MMQMMPMQSPAVPPIAPPVMNSAELMAYLRIGRTKFDELVAGRKLPGFKVGREWRFYRTEIDDWAKRGGTEPTARREAGR